MAEKSRACLDFESVVRDCRPQLVRYVSRLVGEADAEDVVQIVVSKAAGGLAGFRGEASPKSWLFKIATNAAHDWNRARGRGREELAGTNDGENEELRASDDDTQERRLVREQMSQCVGDVLRRLPEGYRAVLALSDCEELSDREMAAALDLTVGAAKIRLHRARARLKEELERECSFYRDQDNVLCCDRKEKSTTRAYPFDASARHQVGSPPSTGSRHNPDQEPPMTTPETLPAKQKHLLGVSAAIAAGCQPCTAFFAAKAREAGACQRGVRLSIESGLTARTIAIGDMTSFADERFAAPELDSTFRAEKAQVRSLLDLAAAVASNAAPRVRACVEAARALGVTDDQIRLAAQIAQTAKRGAERETENALTVALGGVKTEETACCCADTSTSDAAAPTGTVGADQGEAPCGCKERTTADSKPGNGCC